MTARPIVGGTRTGENEIVRKADRLVRRNQADEGTRTRIRAIMDGGESGLRAVLGKAGRELGEDLPAPNLVLSAVERLAQKVGRAPTVKIDPVVIRGDNTEASSQRADTLDRIVRNYDRQQRLDLQLHRLGRWLPGYGYAAWVLRQNRNGTFIGELRDPYDTYPGWFTVDHPPRELAVKRVIDVVTLKEIYPTFDAPVDTRNRPGTSNDPYEQTTEIIEYYDHRGTWVVAPETDQVLDFTDNPLDDEPGFVFMHRPAFNRLQGQYDQTIGLLSMMVRLNVMALMSVQDDVEAPTDIIGEVESGEYRRGRFATNILTPGSQVQRGRQVNTQPAMIQIDRLERQLRLAAGYPVQDDSISPNSFVTGRGLAELGTSASAIVREYHVIIAHALQELDRLRLTVDEAVHGDATRTLTGAKDRARTYTPSTDINGNYVTRRVYGVMAGWDEPTKIINGIQLLQAEIIDEVGIQENLDNFDEIVATNNRIRAKKSENVLFETLQAQAAQGNLQMAAAVNEIRKHPDRMSEILDSFFEEQEQPAAPTPEELGAAGGGAPPDITTVLSRLTNTGEPTAGVQTVSTLGR